MYYTQGQIQVVETVQNQEARPPDLREFLYNLCALIKENSFPRVARNQEAEASLITVYKNKQINNLIRVP